VIAAPEPAGKLPIQEKRHARLDAAGSDLIVWDQPPDRCFNEDRFRWSEEDVSGTRGAGRRVRRPLSPGNRASKGLRGPAEFAVVYGRRGHAAYARNSAPNKEATTIQVHVYRSGYPGNPLQRIALKMALFVVWEIFRWGLGFEICSQSFELILR
jgi:hypothetical protein